MQPRFTYFEVEESLAPTVAKEFRDAWLDGRKVRVNEADSVSPGKKQKENKKCKKPRQAAPVG
jgi:hypothetical protein